MRSSSILILVSVLLIAIPQAKAVDTTEYYGEGSLILEAVPLEVHSLKPPAVANAVEDVPGFKGLRDLVDFRIEKIVRGKLEKTTLGEGSLTEELATSLSKKIFAGSYDSGTPQKKLNSIPFSIAVQDALATFEISREDLGKTTLKLYFRNYNQEATSLVLIKSEKITSPS